jgi:type 1 glutamine amidotransferase
VVSVPHAAAVLVLAVAAALLGGSSSHAGPATPELRILLFTKTAGFRHDSIPAAIRSLRELGAQNHIAVDATEDVAAFTDRTLRRYDVVVFLLTTGDVLDDAGQAAFQRYVRSGGGFAGVHSASDTEHGWAWYGGLVGSYFKAHPAVQPATVVVSDPRDASTSGLPRRWRRTDEWYGFTTGLRSSIRVLATVDEATYAPGDSAMGGNHPIAWSQRYDGGRSWYTALGHTQESYAEPLFRRHLLGGVLWAAGPPVVGSLRSVVRGRRLVVTGTEARCVGCRAQLRVRLADRSAVTLLGIHGATFAGRSAVLPRGRWRYTVTVTSDGSGLRTSRAGTVRIG